MKDNYGKLKNNIIKNYVFSVSKMDLTHGFWMIYLYNKGFSLVQIGLLETIFHIASIAMEIPTGIVADLYTRKLSRIIGRILAIFSLFIVMTQDSFLMIGIGFIISALSYNFESGAGEALVFDTLKEINDTDHYPKIAGRNEITYQFSSLLSFLLGGFIAQMSYELLYGVSIAFGIMSLIIALTFVEPSLHTEDKADTFLKVIKKSIGIFAKDKRLLALTILVELMVTNSTVMYFYLQNYWNLNNISEFQIGFAFAFAAIFGMISGAIAGNLHSFLKDKWYMILASFIMVIGMFLVSFNIYTVFTFAIVSFADSLLFVGLSNYINSRAHSDVRATIISMSGMFFSLFMIIIFPVFGYAVSIVGFKVSFISISIIALIISIYNGLTLKDA
jgi:MFS family permease